MTTTLLFATTNGLGATLLWIAFFGLAALALVLYVPRRFSGPLTEHERRAVSGGLRHRALAVVLAAPLATLSGFLLLLPPLVVLQVPSRPTASSWQQARALDTSWWSHFAWTESTSGWSRATLCELDGDDQDEQALAAAILRAARSGFDAPTNCATPTLDTWALASIELSLIEVAARAYLLTDVVMMPGPRLQEPDPWDIMARTLEQRAITPHFTGRGALAADNQLKILRLTRARLLDGPSPLDVFALVQGEPCLKDYPAQLIAPDGARVDSCTLSAPADCRAGTGGPQRMLRMEVRCGRFKQKSDFLEHETGLLLSAGHGETPVRMSEHLRAIAVQVEQATPDLFNPALERTNGAFAEELKRRALRPLQPAQRADISIAFADDIVIRGPRRHSLAGCEYAGGDGSFSWRGIDPPGIEVADDRITISGMRDALNPQAAGYDPTVFYALMATITWAVNALDSGVCAEREEPRISTSRRPAYPLLTAEQLEVAAASLRRPRESLGLVLLALAVLTLALGLRRSVH